MKKICIFHFSPLELYPPVMNMIMYLDKHLPENYSIRVYSSYSKNKTKLFNTSGKRTRIYRYGKYQAKQSAAARYKLYISYNIRSFLNAWWWGQDSVLYYETFSALPPFYLKKLKPATRLFIHYHEYVAPTEYDAIAMLKKIHRVEKRMYNQATWISHTNEQRLKLFMRDVGIDRTDELQVLPNFPPGEWRKDVVKEKMSNPIKIIYVGSIGLESLYIKEFAQWVEQQQGKVTWDVYSQQDTTELKVFLSGIDSRYIQVLGFVPYYDMPELLRKYDLGVILYKGLSENTVYSAPNKLFEYLTCGLDVWIPKEHLGALSYVQTNSYPKVVAISFSDLGGLDLCRLVSREQLPYVPSSYYYEEEYYRLKDLLL
mgnify:CR=1 FL=1